MLGRISTVAMAPNAGDFRLLDRRVVEVLGRSREQLRYLRGLSMWAGFRQAAVPYVRHERLAGKTTYPFRRMVRLAVDAITSFSVASLQVATIAGFALLGTSEAGAIVAAILWMLGVAAGDIGVPLLIVFLGGVQLICLGILGAYLGRIYDEVRGRPLYVVSETLEAGTSVGAQEREHTRADTRPLAGAAMGATA